jgi:hypothetical protein
MQRSLEIQRCSSNRKSSNAYRIEIGPCASSLQVPNLSVCRKFRQAHVPLIFAFGFTCVGDC